MKTKKSNRANLENKRTLFIQIGFILVLIIVLTAFEWNSKVEYKPITRTAPVVETIMLDMPRTKPEEKRETVKPPTPIEKLIVMKNDVEINEEPIIFSSEDNWYDAIDLSLFDTKETEVDSTYIKVEIMPAFNGDGLNAFRTYVAENIKFPQLALDNGVKGRVIVQFVVSKDGHIKDITLLRKIDPAIDKEVIRVIQNSPKWEPGVQAGRYVNVKFVIPISFNIKAY